MEKEKKCDGCINNRLSIRLKNFVNNLQGFYAALKSDESKIQPPKIKQI